MARGAMTLHHHRKEIHMADTTNTDGDLALSFAEAAQRLHCSVRSIRNLVKRGLLPAFSLSGRVATRISLQALRAFVDAASRRA